MVVRDIDYEYFLGECFERGAPEDMVKKATKIRFADKYSKIYKQGPATWNASDATWTDVPELSIDLAPDSDFGRVRLRRKTCVLSLLGKDDKVLWTSA